MVLCFSWANLGFAQTEESRVAWLIGNAKYEVEHPLKNPVNDIELVRDSLESIGFDVIQSVNIRTFEEFKEKRIEVFNVLKRDSVAVFVFYYAGHAIQIPVENESANYLIPTKAQFSDLEDANRLCIELHSNLIRPFDALESCVKVFVLDACRVNPYESRRYRSGVSGKGLAAMTDPPLGDYCRCILNKVDLVGEDKAIRRGAHPFNVAIR